jgi:hypothetical protein
LSDTSPTSPPPPPPPQAGTPRAAASKPSRYFKPHASPHCDHCGFTLHQLVPGGVCPECGTPYTPESAARLHVGPTAIEALRGVFLPWLLPAFLGAVAILSFGSGRPGIGALLILIVLTPATMTWASYRSARYLLALVSETIPKQNAERSGFTAMSVATTGCLGVVMTGSVVLTVLGTIFAVACLKELPP